MIRARVRGEGKERVRDRGACSKDKRRVRGESIVFVTRDRGRGEGKRRVRAGTGICLNNAGSAGLSRV